MTPIRAPIPFDPAVGDRAVAAVAPPPDWAEVLRGVAGCSPFLAAAAVREADWLGGVWAVDPDAALGVLLRDAAAIEGDPAGPLRVARRRVALLVALADLGGVWDTATVCARLTRFADTAVAVALGHALRAQRIDGNPGLVAMAMGKMGAGELNYSSDIDLILLFDQDRYDPGGYAAVRAKLVRAGRSLCTTLGRVTPEGHVQRVDLRLRPDPRSTPIVMSMEAAERYYEGFGRTWERAAWIKARPCAGDAAAGAAFVDALRPFVWRRHLDFAAIRDALDMRRAIRDAKGLHGAWEGPGHDVKLGRGGIREVEFFAQTHQLIAGGRDPSLRRRGTVAALRALADAGRIEGPEAHDLARCYWRLRDVEHRLQMVQDAQTHAVPGDADGIRRIACLDGWGDAEAWLAGLRDTLRAVDRITGTLYAPRPAPAAAEPPGAEEAATRWATYPALRAPRARDAFGRIRPALMAGLARGARPGEALAAFDGFLRGLPAGVQLFALLEANPALVDLLADIAATVPDLARHLSRNASVLDAVLDGTFFAPLDRFDPPAVPGAYDDALDALRRWHREQHFRIGVHLLRALATPAEAGAAYARLAEATLGAAWRVAEAETARRYGRVAGLALCALGMGSLGAGRLHARSDLDLVVLHDGGTGASDGARALTPGQWAARFAQSLVTTLSAPTGEGRLYAVDMRLRPSGRQGPVAVGFAGWQGYQRREAWVWEHLALTRARPMAGDRALRERVEAARRDLITGTRFDAAAVRAGLADMIGRLRDAAPVGGGLALRRGPGRLQEIELTAQAGALMAGSAARDVAAQARAWPEAEALIRAHAALADAATAARLLSADDPVVVEGAGGAAFLARTTGTDDLAALMARCDARAAEAEAMIARVVFGALTPLATGNRFG